MKNISPNSISRRSFVATATAGIAALSAIGSIATPAHAQLIETSSEWNIGEFNRLVHHPAQVKQLFDARAANDDALNYIRNSLNGLQFGFGIPKDQIQIVAVMHAQASALLMDDYIWKKYQLGVHNKIKDPETGKPAERNIFYPSKTNLKYTSDNIESHHSIYADESIQALQHRGLRLIGCNNVFYGFSGFIAEKSHPKLTHQQVYKELLAHTIPDVLIVAASVAAIALLQSQGHYSYFKV